LDVANGIGVTEGLWPLFVHNLGALLYAPTTSSEMYGVRRDSEGNRDVWGV
jgi:hypothetical protein